MKFPSAIHDYYSVETKEGERAWLAVPRGTPAKLVTTPTRPLPPVKATA